MERGELLQSMKSGLGGPPIGPGGVPVLGRREGISLDYFNNLIMEKMRNENNDDMKSEDVHGNKHDSSSSSSGPPPTVQNLNLPGGSASHVHNPVTSVVHGHPSHYGGLAGRIAAVAAAHARDDSDSRGGDSQVHWIRMKDLLVPTSAPSVINLKW